MDELWRPGYPIDLRTDGQRRRESGDPLSPDFEQQAARVLARSTGACVRLQDDGSRDRMPDISLGYADGRVGFAEVWRALDGRHAAVAATLGQEPVLSAPGLGREWTVRVDRNFRFKDRDGRGHHEWVPALLAEFEAAGQFYEFVPRPDNLAVHPGPLAGRAGRLGIRGLASRPVREGGGGSVRFVPWGVGGRALDDPEAFHAWVDGEVNADSGHMRGNREKLRAAGGDESHAVIGVTVTTPWAVHRALSADGALPRRAPRLPAEFTHLWLIGTDPADRALAWYPDRGWFDPARCWATD
ncbi:hypothetical protein ACFWBI_01255 [Streptomyces sp. NPDC059982]|uniref:hypothetical protein n=1 Tax=unclassified Streptomyces TaxID=2593676 RepID=UPI0036A3463A